MLRTALGVCRTLAGLHHIQTDIRHMVQVNIVKQPLQHLLDAAVLQAKR